MAASHSTPLALNLNQEIATLCKTGYVNDYEATFLLDALFPGTTLREIHNNLLDYIGRLSPTHEKQIKEALSEGAIYNFTIENEIFFCFERMDAHLAHLIQTIFKNNTFPSIYMKSISHDTLRDYWEDENRMGILENGLVNKKYISLPKSAHILIFNAVDFFELILKNIVPAAVPRLTESKEPILTPTLSSSTASLLSRSTLADEGFSRIEMIDKELNRFCHAFKFMSRRKVLNEYINVAATALGVSGRNIVEDDTLERAILNFVCQLSPMHASTLQKVPVGDGQASFQLLFDNVCFYYKKMNKETSDLVMSILKNTFPSIDMTCFHSTEEINHFTRKNYSIELGHKSALTGSEFLIKIPHMMRLLRYIAINRINALNFSPSESKRSTYLSASPIREIALPHSSLVFDCKKVEIDRAIEMLEKKSAATVDEFHQIVAEVLGKSVDEVKYTEALEEALVNMARLPETSGFVVDGNANTEIEQGAICIWYGNMKESTARQFKEKLHEMSINIGIVRGIDIHNPYNECVTIQNLLVFDKGPKTWNKKGYVCIYDIHAFCKALKILTAQQLELKESERNVRSMVTSTYTSNQAHTTFSRRVSSAASVAPNSSASNSASNTEKRCCVIL